MPNSAIRSASREIRQRLKTHKNHSVTFGPYINGGQQGSIFNAMITFNFKSAIKEILCVAKRSNGRFSSTSEFKTHETITASSNLSSSESGVLTSLGIHITDNTPYLLLPKCDAMLSQCLCDLKELRLSKNSDKKILFRMATLTLFKSIVVSLTTFSKLKKIHGDIKPDNWGLRRDKEGYLKLCLIDFGLSKSYKAYKRNMVISGTPNYIAPDTVAQDNQFPFAIDVYAFGQILSDLLGKKAIFHESEPIAQLFKKGEAYIAARRLHPIKSSKERKKYQTKLLTKIKAEINFDSCMNLIVISMLDIIPECRPNLNTLKNMLKHLTVLLSPNDILEKEILSFFDKIVKKVNTTQADTVQDNSANVENNETQPSEIPTETSCSKINPNYFFSGCHKKADHASIADITQKQCNVSGIYTQQK